MTIDEIIKTIKANEKNYMVYGIRCDSRNFEIGEELPCSHNMIDDLYDDETGDYPLLDGTCAIGFGYLWLDGDEEDIETVQKAIDLCRTYPYDNLYLIGGYDYEYGDDDSEIIIDGAEVVGKI